MSNVTKRKIVFILSFTFAIVLFAVLLYRISTPKLIYVINEREIEGAEQQSLHLEGQNNSVILQTKFYDLEGNFETMKLKSALVLKPTFPFIESSKNINLILYPGESISEDTFIYYEITAQIKNLAAGEYRITIKDIYGNLIDEQSTVVKD